MKTVLFIHLLYLLSAYGKVARAESVTIREYPSDVTAVTGSDVILKCVVENLPLGRSLVQWTRDGFALGFTRDIPGIPNYSMVGDESIGEYNLQIKNVSVDDEAFYECQVQIGMMRHGAKLTVLVPPQGPVIDDVIAETPGVINVLAYSLNLITCRSWNGKPAAELAWFKDGVKLDTNVTYASTVASNKMRNSSATLRLWPTDIDDRSTYECAMIIDSRFEDSIDTNGLSSRKSIRINVQKSPNAQISLSPTDVLEGKSVKATCDSSGSKPQASSFIWYLGGQVMEGKTSSSVTFYPVNRTLNGVEVACRSVSSVGQSESSIAILNVLYAPTLMLGPEDVTSNISETIELSCSWDSNPLPSITWYRRGEQDVVVGEGEVLTIDVVDQSVGGEYVCVADAPGVGSRSASARLDVLGPPMFKSPDTQFATIGKSGKVECLLESKPGVSHVTWSWERKGEAMTLQDNNTGSIEKRELKYQGMMVTGSDAAYLIIYDVSEEDMTQYNCTVQNAYGTASATVTMEESAGSHTVIMVGSIVGGVIGAILVVIIIIIFCVCCIKRQSQQKTFTPEHESLRKENIDPEMNNRTEMDMPRNGKLLSPDADDDNPSTSASLSSRDGVPESIVLDEYNRGSAHNDDGYHTEEANSWNRAEKTSPGSSPARSARDEYQRSNLPVMPSPPLTSSPRNASDRAGSPYNSDLGSDMPTNYMKYNMPPYETYQSVVAYGPNGVVDLPPARAMSPVNIYPGQQFNPNYYQPPAPSSSGYRSGTGYPSAYPLGYDRPRGGSNATSVVSSHRSVTPIPAYAAMLGRATPVSVLGDQGPYLTAMPTIVHAQTGPSSSQSSLDNPSSSVAADPYENAAKMSQLSSRISQASRSSEFLGNKQLTARMATHV